MRSTTTSAGKRGRVHGEPVILRGDFDPAGFQILDRLVGAAMAEFELEGLSAEGLAQNLVPQANPENRNAVVDQVARRLHGVTERRRVARAVGKKYAGRLVLPAPRRRSAVAGTTCTRKPCWRSRRKMLYFMP